MAGPVWRFELETDATCGVCFRKVSGVFVEGEIVANEMQTARIICPECYNRAIRMVVHGELGRSIGAPGYSHR